jgi:hypothetical protein
MINLITTFYLSKYNSPLDNERTDELIEALINNLNSDIIEKIHLFIDDNDTFEKLNEIKSNNINSHKIVSINIKHQPTYHDFFNYILNNLPNNICMISNSDIYLHSYDINLINLLVHEKYCYALTRYDYEININHDCFIFNSKYLNNNLDQNLLEIEKKIILLFSDLKFKVFNPCKQIKIVNLQNKLNSSNDNNELFIKKNFWYVPPSLLLVNKNDCIIYCITSNNYINTILEDKEYTWGDYNIKFLKNNKIEAFGDGNYEIINDFNIIANFGGREHNIKFNNDYTEFTSIRNDDLCIVNGSSIINNNFINKTYTWGDYSVTFLENYKMNTFGAGNYEIIDDFNIIAKFGGREHNIKFNNDYTEFTSIRKDDLCFMSCKLFYIVKYI